MKLDALIQAGATHLSGPAPAEVDIRAVHTDSRKVEPGALFVAIVGHSADGHDHVAAALEAGAVAILVERPVPVPESVTVVQVEDTRLALARAAAALHGEPARHLSVVGLTGTNGKTTTSAILESILDAAHRRPGIVGTVTYRFGDERIPAPLTTPGAEVLQGLLARMVDAGVDTAVLEVSSHALDQARVAEIPFAAAGFTNLSRDHLDYHADLEDYFEAKARLFLEHLAPEGTAVVNLDDAWGQRLVERLVATGRRPLTVCTCSGTIDHAAPALRVTAGAVDRTGSVLAFHGEDVEGLEVHLPLVGAHNVANAALAAGLALALGLSITDIAEGLATCPPVPGRLEPVTDAAGTRSAFVDYAHTDDALRRVVDTLASVRGEGRLGVVFGCGGDRDPGKRPLMAAATAGADFVVVTSDNPRTEDPQAIIDAIVPGLPEGVPHHVEVDRARAIEHAVAWMRPGDLLLVAGKGHEDYQIIGTEKRPFDDRQVTRDALTRVADETRTPEDSPESA